MKKNSIQRWAVAIALVLTGPSLAWAHAFLDHAEPKAGSAVARAPGELKLWFTQKLEPAFSSVQVQDAAGREMDKKNAHLDVQDRSLLIVSLPQLPAGAYTVIWHAVSVDTHKTQGRFKFTVK